MESVISSFFQRGNFMFLKTEYRNIFSENYVYKKVEITSLKASYADSYIIFI